MAPIFAKPRRCPTLATLTYISVAINVMALIVLLSEVIVLREQTKKRRAQCQDSRQPENDVMRLSDVTDPEKGRRRMDDISRYCFREGPEACRKRGLAVKTGPQGESLCCGHLGNHLFEVLGEEIHERLEIDRYRGRKMKKIKQYITQLHHDSQTATFRPAAHVGILPNGNLTGPDYNSPRVQWDGSGEGSFLTGRVIHGGDRLRVTKPGYYYVYTGLQFNADPTTVQSEAIVAYLFRTVNGSEDTRLKLMASRESSCRRSRGDSAVGPVSMYMAGIYLLRKDDEISVRTASQSLLHRSPASTYLGLHMV